MTKLDWLRWSVAYIKHHALEPIILLSAVHCRMIEDELAKEGDPLFKTGEAMEKKYPSQVADLDGVAIIEDQRCPAEPKPDQYFIPNWYMPVPKKRYGK